MSSRFWLALSLAGVFVAVISFASIALGCCPAPPPGKPVVNADQTVIIIWDAANKTQHFIRQASFKSEADDFGFLVPSPNQPELNESGNDAFPNLLKVTAPPVKTIPRPSGNVSCGCASKMSAPGGASFMAQPPVKVLQEQLVAGFNATVLEAKSAKDLVDWLKDHGYAFSPEVQAWAKPYVDAGWKITALKVAKSKDAGEKKSVAASALRMTFKTDWPLFPYREPDPKSFAKTLDAKNRLLRIYFLAEARYRGELTKQVPWTGQVVWANKLKPEQRKTILKHLNLPENTGPAQWWLTEFEDNWPYKVAPADVYFSRDTNQDTVQRPPIFRYSSVSLPTDVMAYALAAIVILPPLVRRMRRRK